MTDASRPRFAIVVATRNRGAKIVPLLQSILAGQEPSWELAIVDQSSDDQTRDAVRPFLADMRIKFVHSSRPGTSRARNQGAKLTSAPLIVITDDDCIVPRDWLAAVGAAFEIQPRVGVVFSNVDPVPVSEPGLTPHIHFAQNRSVKSVQEAWVNKQLSLGAGMSLRRTTFEEVGGFDEVLGPGSTFPAAEDNDLAWRCLLKGWWVYENADATVMHDGFRSLEQLRELVKRDFYGMGGTVAKYLKCGHWQIGSLIAAWTLEYGVLHPARDVMAGRAPRGFRRPYMLWRGLVDGLRRPVDPGSIRYRT